MSVLSTSDALFQYVDGTAQDVHHHHHLRPSEDDMEQLRAQLAEWFRLDEQIRKLQNAIKERKTHQRALSKSIQEFMSSHKYDNVQTQKGKIVYKVCQVKAPVKLGSVKDIIMQNEGLSGKLLLDKIFNEERPVIEKKSLRHVRPPVSFHLQI
jgi:hypothetical protein